jgi:hypothetical protein
MTLMSLEMAFASFGVSLFGNSLFCSAGFLVAAGREDLERLDLDRRFFRHRAHGLPRDGVGLVDGREADDARQLLDEVGLDVDVEAMRRRGHEPAGFVRQHTHAERLERELDVVVVDGRPEELRDALTAQLDFQALRQDIGVLHDVRGTVLAAGDA